MFIRDRDKSVDLVYNKENNTWNAVSGEQSFELVKMNEDEMCIRDSSMPMAKAISFPLNHFTIIFETVIPAISTPTPNIAYPLSLIHILIIY